MFVESDDCKSTSSLQKLDSCSLAPKSSGESVCYNGGLCSSLPSSSSSSSTSNFQVSNSLLNFTCICPAGFSGKLCELNIDDCVDHQCQNGAACVDGLNSYRCVCRDPQTSGEYCELLNQTIDNSQQVASSAQSSNAIPPIALPIISAATAATSTALLNSNNNQIHQQPQPQLQTKSAIIEMNKNELASVARSIRNDFVRSATVPTNQSLEQKQQQHQQQQSVNEEKQQQQQPNPEDDQQQQQQPQHSSTCSRVSTRQILEEENGCKSIKAIKISACHGSCNSNDANYSNATNNCIPLKFKQKRVRIQCDDGATYVKTIDIVKSCGCSPATNLNSTIPTTTTTIY